ncbi:hypothetical protein [Klebsiella pneumoniae]|uniref:hypothetical protein n=1 Tax=Klebsiella pneumoniae TaxID=573 RepID=UPI0015C447AE
MAQDYQHGGRVVEFNDFTLSLTTVITAIVGMVCNRTDAVAPIFLLHQPVLLTV